VSSLRGHPLPSELSLELESSSSSCQDWKLQCKEAHAPVVKMPVLEGGRLAVSADPAGPAGMFLLCVYSLSTREGLNIQPGNGCEGAELPLTDAKPAYLGERELPRLTPTETEVMDRLAQGRTNREIAEEMFISMNTVKTHVRSIFQKFGVNSRASAVRLATAAGLLDHWLPPASP